MNDLSKEERYEAQVAVQEFKKSVAWRVLTAKMEAIRQAKVQTLIDAAKRDHVSLAESAGIVRAIDTVYDMFNQIIQEGMQD